MINNREITLPAVRRDVRAFARQLPSGRRASVGLRTLAFQIRKNIATFVREMSKTSECGRSSPGETIASAPNFSSSSSRIVVSAIMQSRTFTLRQAAGGQSLSPFDLFQVPQGWHWRAL